MGNNNTFNIRGSEVSFTINGNNNQFNTIDSNVTFVVNGNNNYIQAANSHVNFGVNGNNNKVGLDARSELRRTFDNGINNRCGQQQ